MVHAPRIGEAPLKVALDATPLLGRRTGVGEFCAGALVGLRQRPDLTVSAYAVSWRRHRWILPLLPEGVDGSQRPMPARPLHAAWSRFNGPAIERFIGNVGVVHGTNYVVPPARRAARVVTVHDLTTVRYPELCDRGTLAFPELVRRAVASGAWVHTPSEFVAAEVVDEWGVPVERVRAVHHGIPDHHVGNHPGDCVVEAPYILCLGTVEPRKDLPTLVAAFGDVAGTLTDIRLVIAGHAGWGTDDLDAAIRALPATLRDRVVRLGYVDPQTRARLLVHASIFAYPSLYEGFGFPPLEAMRAGVPVVATRGGAVPEVVADAALLVEARQPEELATALARAASDSALRADLVARGSGHAATFSWENCAAGLARLYQDAAAAGD